MADLGNIGTQITSFPGLRICPQLPLTRTARLFTDEGLSYLDGRPILAFVDSPSPGAGFRSIECYTPGTLLFERPVDAGQSLTFAVKCQKNATYADLTSGLGIEPRNTLPFIEVTMPDGTKARATKNSTIDAFENLTVGPLVVAVRGVALVKLVAEGNFGDNLIFVEEAKRPAVVGPKCWWADLAVSGS